MQMRRAALVFGALILTVTPLSACGGWASERNYTPAVGANHRDADVDVLGAVIVAPDAGKGVFVANLVNNEADRDDKLTGISSPAGLTFEGGEGDIPALGSLNLSTDGGIPVTGEFEAGEFVPVSLSFESGETVDLEVPVVLPTDEFEGLGG